MVPCLERTPMSRAPANLHRHVPSVVRTSTMLRRQARMRTVDMLCSLLRNDTRLRAMWSTHAPSAGRGIHQGAITQVLAEYQWRVGQEPIENVDLPRQLKDTVSRALSGKTLSRRALTLFIAAFDIDDRTAERLWATWHGSDQVFEPYADLDRHKESVSA